MDLETLTRQYGYPAVVLGTMLQGETILLLCGLLAHRGYMSLWLVWLVATLSATTGDVSYFELGRHYGERLLNKLPKRLARTAEWLRRVIGRHPNQILLSMRFLFGTHILMPLVCGMTPISTRRFLILNVIAAAMWSGAFIAVGYLFGMAAKSVIGDLEHAEIYLLMGILAIAAGYHWISRIVRRRSQVESDHFAE